MGEKGLLKQIHDSAWAWNLFQGPVYNRRISEAAADYFDYLVALMGMGSESPALVLDVGSGAGSVSLMLARAHPTASVVGIDYAPMQVRAANRRKRKECLANCTFQAGDAMNIPFEDDAYDMVVTVNSIKHWPDPVRGLSEIRRVLCPLSRVFVAEADRNASPEELLAFSEKYGAWYIWPPFMRWCLRNVVFGKSYIAEEIVEFAKIAGFSDSTTRSVPGPFFLVILTK